LEEATANRVISGASIRERVRLTARGRTRALVHAVAAGTGLRRGKLARLRWKDLDLGKQVLSVPAASAKSRKDQTVPLRSDLAEALAGYRPTDALPTDRVFPAATYPRLLTFKHDLVAARLAKVETTEDGTKRIGTEDDSGRALDFHGLRVTTVSGLVARGVHPRVAQALARHAKIETTMQAEGSMPPRLCCPLGRSLHRSLRLPAVRCTTGAPDRGRAR
jgi:integrase